MKININKTYHFNTVSIDFEVNNEIDETENALNYLKYLLESMDSPDVPGHAPEKKPNQNPTPAHPCTEKQIALLRKLYKDDLKCDFSTLSSEDASKLIDNYYK